MADWFFETGSSAPLGWQLLLEAFTGCRTAEVLALRWDAKPEAPGWRGGGHLWLDRRKGGVNPWAVEHDALRALLEALEAWQDRVAPGSPWVVPSLKCLGEPLGRSALVQGLQRAGPVLLGRPITSHGMRSFYVTVRRSQGIGDGQIAAEIGDRTRPSIIASTYGAVPPNWQGRPGIGWLPEARAPARESLGTDWRRKSGLPGGLLVQSEGN